MRGTALTLRAVLLLFVAAVLLVAGAAMFSVRAGVLTAALVCFVFAVSQVEVGDR